MREFARRALLSRIGGQDPAPVDEVRSILAHLQQLLNTRQGDAPVAPGYGVIDFADLVHGFPGAIQQLARAIRSTILEFEPRLRNVAVRHVPDEDGLTLRFEIAAQLARGPTPKTLRLATTVKPGGQIEISG
jgi:type VI secretion system protein